MTKHRPEAPDATRRAGTVLDDPSGPGGCGLWAATAPPAPPCAALSGEVTADIAIVGAGYTGLSAALHAAATGARVAVVEAGAIGQGGSGRNVGLVNAGLWLMPDTLEARLGPDHGPRLLAALADGPAQVWRIVRDHEIDCEARPAGTLHCAPDLGGAAALRERHAQWRRRGAAVDLLDAAATARRTGARGFRAALFDPRAGTIQPLAYARGLARAACAAGAQVFTDSPATAITPEAAGGWRVKTPGGCLRARALILAGNTYGTAAAAGLRTHQSVLPYFNIATAPLPDPLRAHVLPGGEGAWDTAKILTSFRMDARGRLVLGSVGALGAVDAATHRAWARRRLAQLYPALAEQPFESAWFGRIGTTPDALPRFCAHGRGACSISGFNGRGIAPGTVFGAMLARLALGQIGPEAIPLPLHDGPPPADPLRHLREPFWRAGAALWHLAGARLG